jgi:hypothetical protein
MFKGDGICRPQLYFSFFLLIKQITESEIASAGQKAAAGVKVRRVAFRSPAKPVETLQFWRRAAKSLDDASSIFH